MLMLMDAIAHSIKDSLTPVVTSKEPHRPCLPPHLSEV